MAATLRGEAAVALPDGTQKRYGVALTLPDGVAAGAPHAAAVLLLAGAGGGMDAPLLLEVAQVLATRARLPVLRFDCRGPAFERRVVVARALMLPGAALGLGPCARWVAVGVSLGARVAARLVADGVACGAAMLAFPLVAAASGESRLAQLLAAHAASPGAPLLLVRGERDELAPTQPWAAALDALRDAGAAPRLHDVAGAGHSLTPPAGPDKAAARERMLAAVAAFVADAAAWGEHHAAAAGEASGERPAKRPRS